MKRSNSFWMAVLLALSAFLWSGNASPLLAQNIQVTAANPNSAAEGTVNLNVIVSGSGFKRGAVAKWFETGTTNPGDVTVNLTAFDSSSQLTANITVSTAGFTGSYDIVVQNADGRTGKGTGLFAVTKSVGTTSCTSFNVTAILNDTDNNNAPFQYQSDGLGPYTTFKVKRNSVNTVIDSSCGWSLDTTASTSRGIRVTLAYPYSSPSQPPPFTSATLVKGRINTHCSTNPANNGIDLGTMTSVNQKLICPINVAFYAPNGVWYNTGDNPYNWPGATMAQVTCTGASSGQCNQWTIVPDPSTSVPNPLTGQYSSIGELILPPCVGCDGGTGIGLYFFSYSFLIHK